MVFKVYGGGFLGGKFGVVCYLIKTKKKLCYYKPAIKENWLTAGLIVVPI